MLYVHYIWMGDQFPALEMLEGPISIAHYSLTSIYPIMWVPAALVNNAMAAFSGKAIAVRSVDDMLAGHYSQDHCLQHIDPITTGAALQLLASYAAFAAQKDLLSHAILAEFGGYYFDTTAAFTQEPIFYPESTQIKVPLLEEQSIPWKINQDGTLFALPLIDVWAMFSSTPGSEAFKTIVTIYIQIVQEHFSGIGTDPAPLLIPPAHDADALGPRSRLGLPALGCNILSSPGLLRDRFLAAITLYATYKGIEKALDGCFCQEGLRTLSWSASLTAEGHHIVYALGLKKTYWGSWKTTCRGEQQYTHYFLGDHETNYNLWERIISNGESLSELKKENIEITPAIRNAVEHSLDPKQWIVNFQRLNTGLSFYEKMALITHENLSLSLENLMKLYEANLYTEINRCKLMDLPQEADQKKINSSFVMLCQKIGPKLDQDNFNLLMAASALDLDKVARILLLLYTKNLLTYDNYRLMIHVFQGFDDNSLELFFFEILNRYGDVGGLSQTSFESIFRALPSCRNDSGVPAVNLKFDNAPLLHFFSKSDDPLARPGSLLPELKEDRCDRRGMKL